MPIYVYHNMDPNPCHRFDDSPAVVRHSIDNCHMSLVAVVDSDNLDRAYQVTNHINESWEKNHDVKPYKPEGNRSTSVGDIFVRPDKNGDEDVFIVANFGFERFHINPERLIRSEIEYSRRNS